MRVITVEKENETIQVTVLKHKESDQFSFVNLTKGHICPCKFDSYGDAMKELNQRLECGKIKSWSTTEKYRDGRAVQEIFI